MYWVIKTRNCGNQQLDVRDIVSLAVILSMKISIGEFVYNFLLQMKGMSVAVVK